MNKRRYGLLALLVSLVLSCGESGEEPEVTEPPANTKLFGLDKSADCPEGYVGYTFPTKISAKSEDTTDHATQSGFRAPPTAKDGAKGRPKMSTSRG